MTCSTPSGQPWSPGQHRVAPIWRRGCVCSHESAARREAGPSCNPFRSWTTPTSAWPGTSTQRALRPRSASEASRHALTSERAAFTTQRWSGGCRGRRSGFSFGSGVIESESGGSTPGAATQQRPGLSPHDGVKQLLLDTSSADRLGVRDGDRRMAVLGAALGGAVSRGELCRTPAHNSDVAAPAVVMSDEESQHGAGALRG
jgi:hypothetical protein